MLTCYQLHHEKGISVNFLFKIEQFLITKMKFKKSHAQRWFCLGLKVLFSSNLVTPMASFQGTIFGSENRFPLVPHISVSEYVQHWLRLWLVAYSAPSHYVNQSYLIGNWTVRNKLRWNFNQNTKLFIHKNASEEIACEIPGEDELTKLAPSCLQMSRNQTVLNHQLVQHCITVTS